MKKFRNFIAEEMSVTLKQHGSTSYKVHSVGSKMKAHGGIKPGETVHDHHIDDLRDSGIKVRYHKEDVDVNEGFDKIGKSGRHDVHFTDTSDYHWSSKHASGVSHGGKGSDPAHEDQFHYQFKHHKIDVNDNQSKTKMSHVKQRVQASGVSPHHVDNVSKHIHSHITAESVQYEAIERKADSKLIMVTDPNTGKTILRRAPRKEIEIGKGKMESVQVDEISDKMKVNYINKANKEISDKEKAGQNKPNSIMNKDTMKRRMGVRMAKSKLGEGESYAQKMAKGFEKSKTLNKNVKKKEVNKPGQSYAQKIATNIGEEEKYSKKQVRMGKGVAFDKRYKQGNYSGAHKTIEKIKKGLASHPKVADALRRANEEFNKGE